MAYVNASIPVIKRWLNFDITGLIHCLQAPVEYLGWLHEEAGSCSLGLRWFLAKAHVRIEVWDVRRLKWRGSESAISAPLFNPIRSTFPWAEPPSYHLLGLASL